MAVANSQKRSKEKNIIIEETHKRNEASMARKRANAKAINPAAANSGTGTPDGSLSPSTTGAMDSLLEKLRAAAPQARDTRDRRRRARLKDRHQVRIASGQSMPDLGEVSHSGTENEEPDKPLLSPIAAVNEDAPSEKMEPISEGEDVAERAASMLQGLRGNADGDGDTGRPGSRDGSLRVRRRRESASDERQHRRSRRRVRESSSTAGEEGETLSPRPETPIPEIQEPEGEDGGDEAEDMDVDVPKTVVVPPSPEGAASQPVLLYDGGED